MSDSEIEATLARFAGAPPQVEPALIERIAASIKPSLRPVRPVGRPVMLIGGLFLICAAVAIAGGSIGGFQGIEALSPLRRGLIFLTLGALIWAAGRELVCQTIPGSRHALAPSVLLSISCALLLALFALLFQDYHTDRFVSAGLICLGTGLLYAVPIGVLSGWLLRRGFAVSPVSAGLVGGALAGLGGVAMLELHCPNFEALHVLVWHTAVVPVSAAAGALAGWAFSRRGNAAA